MVRQSSSGWRLPDDWVLMGYYWRAGEVFAQDCGVFHRRSTQLPVVGSSCLFWISCGLLVLGELQRFSCGLRVPMLLILLWRCTGLTIHLPCYMLL